MFTSSLLKRANRLLIKKANEVLKPYNITHAYTYFLLELYSQDGLTQTELRQRVEIEQPTAVRTLDRMERDGFIRRESCPADRRAWRFYLTEKATNCKNPILTSGELLNQQALMGFNTLEKKQFEDFLERLMINLKP